MRVDVFRPETHPREYRCSVDGVDVTGRCFAADDVEGWADCYALDEEGHHRIDREKNELVRERLTGLVVLTHVGGAA